MLCCKLHSYFQAFFPAHTLHQFSAHPPTFPIQQRADTSIAIARKLPAQVNDSFPEFDLIGSHFLFPVVIAAFIKFEIFTRPTHIAQSGSCYFPNHSSLLHRAHHFFAFTCSSTLMLSNWSATIFLSSTFSLSSSRSLLASATSMRPYLCFQR